MSVRVRFAPSPTGTLHIGGARTALFNYLFARNQKGKFILRIEDTDRERSTQEFTNAILEGMAWLGLDHDEGPFFQSERTEIYKKAVQKLLTEEKAYKCYCSSEELEKMRQEALAAGKKPKYDNRCRNKKDQPGLPAATRIKAPLEGTTSFHDICRGTISYENTELDDLIIARSDGSPTYNLTVVVDDIDMKITHVIRGDDHINNTPRQIILYNALGYKMPEFAHLPMIFGPDKKKLSKRHAAVALTEYREMGFLNEAVMNYLAKLGWSFGDQEIFTREELIQHFDLATVGISPAVFDIEKLKWVNSQHLLKYDDAVLLDRVIPFLEKRGLKVKDRTFAVKAVHSERERGKTLDELAEISAFYFRDEVIFDEKAKDMWLNAKGKEYLNKIQEKLAPLSSFEERSLEAVFKQLLEELGCKMVDLAQPCRVALTGTTVSPGIYEVMAILGKEKTLKRMKQAL